MLQLPRFALLGLAFVLGFTPGCPTEPPVGEVPVCGIGGVPGLTDGSVVNPFPSAHVLVEADTSTGCRVEVPADALPRGNGDPLPIERFAFRDGLSPGQTSFWWPQSAIDGTTLPPWRDAAASLEPDASVQIWDLDAGARLPGFAELDAFPEQSEHQRALLVRPLRGFPPAARVAVVITTRVRSPEGEALPSPSAFAAIRDGEADAALPVTKHYRALLERLVALGVPTAEVVFAWDFVVGTTASATAPLDHVLATMRAELPMDPSFAPPVRVDALLDADTGTPPAAGLWRELVGAITLTHFLWDEDDGASPAEHDAGTFRLDAAGLPLARGDADAYFVAVVPESVRLAAPGTVPVVVFGHGIFSSPHEYLGSSTDANGTIELLNRLGAVGIGGEWRGLTERDRPDAVRVANNLGRFPLLTDKMVQGVSNQLALPRLLKTAFADHPVFAAAAGGSLLDLDRILYFGISLGGIEGLTLLANSEVIRTGVCHVPGSTWSTMLERSTHWNTFETFVMQSIDRPWDRQLVYAASQILWDAVDPIVHAAGLADRQVLMQVSVGDEQVPNFTAESLARTVGLPLVGPPVAPVALLTETDAPLGPGSSGYMQFDSQLGTPPDSNRPAASNYGAHAAIRHTEEVMAQIEAFFAAGQEGTIVQPCGGQPCVLNIE